MLKCQSPRSVFITSALTQTLSFWIVIPTQSTQDLSRWCFTPVLLIALEEQESILTVFAEEKQILLFSLMIQKLYTPHLEIQGALLGNRSGLQTHLFCPRIKSLNLKEVKVKPIPLASYISTASLGGLGTQLMYL